MTGGVVVVLGDTGRNFAAGMSGGMAFLYDPDGELPDRLNHDMVTLEPLTSPEDVALVQELLGEHVQRTGSARAALLLDEWYHTAAEWVKVMPNDLKRVLEERQQAELERESADTTGEQAADAPAAGAPAAGAPEGVVQVG